MIKRNVCLIVTFIMLLSLFSQEQIYLEFSGNGCWAEKQETWYEYNTTGKKVHIKAPYNFEYFFEYDLSNNMIFSKDDSEEYYYTYDVNNNLISKKSNSIEYWYTYDNHNTLIFEKSADIYGHTSFIGYEFEYDEHGNIIHTKNLSSYEEWDYEYKYDSRGNIIFFHSDYEDKWYAYDKNNNLTYLKDNDSEKWYEYDSKGNIVHKITKFYKNHKSEDFFIRLDEWFEFDRYNNLIHYKDSTTNEKWYEYEYDSKNRIIHEVCYCRENHTVN